MEPYLFQQLRFVRKNTLKQIEGVSKKVLLEIPQGFSNNVLWNLGHILFVHEKLAFGLVHEEMGIPEHYTALFAPGTKPTSWKNPLPSVDELTKLLHLQIERIEQAHAAKTDVKLEKTYVTSAGLQLSTLKQCLSCLLYHEGMHLATIKALKQSLGSL